MHLDKKTIDLIKNSLRRATTQWHIRAEVLKEAKTRIHIGKYKNGKDKYKVKYQCNVCKHPRNIEDVEVDHIVEVAKGLNGSSNMTQSELFLWISQLFCEKDNLQVLCKGCHANKTMRFTSGRVSKSMRKGR